MSTSDGHGNRLLIASNRLPVTAQDDGGKIRLMSSTGGLATAMQGPHLRTKGLWFGWTGDLSEIDPDARARLAEDLQALRVVAIDLTAEEVTRHYDGFSNGVLWPLFHYLLDKVNLDAEADWQSFQAVNLKFAERIAAEHRKGDVIWIHDYQLALVPGFLRRWLPDARIGFFLHVPFPAADVFRILPWRADLLRGILGADLVGFHTASYRHNFNLAAAHVLGVDLGLDALVYEGRSVRTDVHPIGIDAAVFEGAAESGEVAEKVEALRAAAAGKTILVGVDRLDYTKGLPRRLLAVDRLLERRPDLREKIHFVQVAVPSRERVDAYAQLRRTVNELVGQINSRHGSAAGAPVQLLYRSVPFSELVALYRAADVMLVTPLRDGMNLVAKEYVASRTDCDGVLVLSELAGAAAELPQAVQVNPYDIGAVASAIETAIEMPREERRRRMRAMRRSVSDHDVHVWADGFLYALSDREAQAASSTRASISALETELRSQPTTANRPRVVVLDYDGTLTPLAPLPDMAVPDADLLDLLAALAESPKTTVHVVSGRARGSLEAWFGGLPLALHAEHGLWSRAIGGSWVATRAPNGDWRRPLMELVAAHVARTPGALLEEKTAGVAFHYRGTDPILAAVRLRELRERLAPLLLKADLELLEGARVLEVRPRGVHKGNVVAALAAERPRGSLLLIVGDDVTDEDMFEAAPPDAVTIKVGDGPTRARWRLASTVDVRRCLRLLLDPNAAMADAADNGGPIAREV